MVDHIRINLREAVEEAAKTFAKDSGKNWDELTSEQKLRFREVSVAPIKAAAPFIIQQVLDDLISRKYDIE